MSVDSERGMPHIQHVTIRASESERGANGGGCTRGEVDTIMLLAVFSELLEPSCNHERYICDVGQKPNMQIEFTEQMWHKCDVQFQEVHTSSKYTLDT